MTDIDRNWYTNKDKTPYWSNSYNFLFFFSDHGRLAAQLHCSDFFFNSCSSILPNSNIQNFHLKFCWVQQPVNFPLNVEENKKANEHKSPSRKWTRFFFFFLQIKDKNKNLKLNWRLKIKTYTFQKSRMALIVAVAMDTCLQAMKRQENRQP